MRRFNKKANCYIRLEPVRDIPEFLKHPFVFNLLCTNMGSFPDAFTMLERLTEYNKAHVRNMNPAYLPRQAMHLKVLADLGLPSSQNAQFTRVLMDNFLEDQKDNPWIAFTEKVKKATYIHIIYSERPYYPNKNSETGEYFHRTKTVRKSNVKRLYFIKLMEESLKKCDVTVEYKPVLNKLDYYMRPINEKIAFRKFNEMISEMQDLLDEYYGVIVHYFSMDEGVYPKFIQLLGNLQRMVHNPEKVKFNGRSYPALYNPDLVYRYAEDNLKKLLYTCETRRLMLSACSG